MITEDYVSFETAKLLKEKGFEDALYGDRTTMPCIQFEYSPSAKLNYFSGNPKGYPAPTLQMAMKWLREEHKLHIQIWILEENGYWFDIEKILNAQYKHKSLYSTGLKDIYFNSYEEACDEAIKYCLENLI